MTSDQTLVVVARWRTTEASLDSVLRQIAELRPLSLAEPGCLSYEAFRALDDPTYLLLVERYRDQSALDAHVDSSHYQDKVVGQVRPLLTDRQVEILRPLNQP